MNTGGAFVAGAIVSKLLLDKTGWNESVKAVEKDLTGLNAKAAQTGAQWIGFGKSLATVGVAVAGAFTAMTIKAANYGEALFDLSQKTGVSAAVLSSFKLAAEQSGSSLEGVATAFKFLSRNMAENDKNFAKIGVAVKDAKGQLRPMADVMVEVADKFSKMPDGAEKSALALQLFGRSGSELIPMLNLGAQGLEEAMKKARELGLVMSDEDAKASDAFGDRLVELKGAVQGLTNSIGKQLLPAGTALVKTVTDVIAGIGRAIENSGAFGKALVQIIPTWGLLTAAVGAVIVAIGTLMKALPLLTGALGTTTGALMASVTAWTAVAAAVVYYISVLGQLSDAKERLKASEDSLAEVQGKGITKLQEAARRAGMTSAAMDEFINRFRKFGDGFVGLALKAAKAGEAGEEVAAAMAAMATENVEAWKKLHPEVDTYGKDIADLLTKYNQLSRTKLTEELAATREELKRLQASAESTPGAIEAVKTKIREMETALNGPLPKIEDLTAALEALKKRWGEVAGMSFEDFEAWQTGKMKIELTPELEQEGWDAAWSALEEKAQAEVNVVDGILGDLVNSSRDAGYASSEAIQDAMRGLTEGGTLPEIKLRIAEITQVLQTMGGSLTLERIRELEGELARLKAVVADSTPWGKFVSNVADAFSRLKGLVDPIINQMQMNREIAIENEYKTRLDYINRTVTDEEQKQKAITALEAEYELKKSKARAAGAKTQKAFALAQAIINTAEAVSKALAQGGFLLGIPWAAIVGALGAVQIATIAAQPIPMAEGGKFEEPTLLQNVLVGEAGPEYLLPEKKLTALVRDAMAVPFFTGAPLAAAAGAGSGATITVNFNAPLIQAQGYSKRDIDLAGEQIKEVVLYQLKRTGRRF